MDSSTTYPNEKVAHESCTPEYNQVKKSTLQYTRRTTTVDRKLAQVQRREINDDMWQVVYVSNYKMIRLYARRKEQHRNPQGHPVPILSLVGGEGGPHRLRKKSKTI